MADERTCNKQPATIGSLFSGYGGLDLACENFFDASVIWHCEWDTEPSKILSQHWPQAANYRDITQVDWSKLPSVDILTGGYPCQPFSTAGNRKGSNDDRHLWPYVRQAIRHLRPRFTVLENVAGHRSLGFDRVLGDVAEDGMHAQWVTLRASDIGAPHRRERIFIVIGSGETLADAYGERWRQRQGQPVTGQAQQPAAIGGLATLPDEHWGEHLGAIRRWEEITRSAPKPVELPTAGRARLSAPFVEWMMGLPEGWVTKVPGVPRLAQLKALGNGVVPQQAEAALREIAGFTVRRGVVEDLHALGAA